jgi:hypothetical protein
MDAAVCKPNFSGPGRVRRTRVGIAALVIAAGLAITAVALGWVWWARALVALPVGVGTASLLQVTRNTCVAHAAAGTFEHEDFSTTKQSDVDAAASRKVAKTITRDALFAALAMAALAYLSMYLR